VLPVAQAELGFGWGKLISVPPSSNSTSCISGGRTFSTISAAPQRFKASGTIWHSACQASSEKLAMPAGLNQDIKESF